MRALLVDEAGRERAVGEDELEALTQRTAAGLTGRGVRAGDVVLVRLPKGLEWLTAMRALLQMGAISLSCPAMLTRADVDERLARSRAVLALLEPGDLPQADGPAPTAELPADAPAFLLFTSGTEGGPKGALHPRGYVEANRLQAERWMGVRPGDRVWCTAASGWSKSLRNVWLAPELCRAETVIHQGRFEAAQRLELIARLRPDVLCMSPTEYRLCARSDGFAGHDLSGLREAVAAGEALDAETIARWGEAHGVHVRDGYGQTETGAVTGVGPGEAQAPGSIGRPLPGVEVRIVEGELCVVADSLPTFFSGYWEDAAATAAKLVDGLWHTGDLVSERGGLLWFEGRRDDVISSSGYRIGPGEVEQALRSHPAVAEAAAVGLPDRERGQLVHADVVLAAGREPGPLLAQELSDHVRQVTAPYKRPRSLRFVQTLPRTATGKVRRAAVRDQLAAASGGAIRVS